MAITYRERLERYMEKHPGATIAEARGHGHTPEHGVSDLNAAIKDPERYAQWWANASLSAKPSGSQRETLMDKAVENFQRQMTEANDASRIRTTEKIQSGDLTKRQLEIMGKMTQAQWAKMASLAGKMARSGDMSMDWLLYH